MRILHFVSSLSMNSGVMAVIMNYYRHIDRDKIQFDFIYYKPFEIESTYQREIELLGGNIYIVSKPSLSIKSLCDIMHFFDSHKREFEAIHIHEVYLTFLLAPIAHKYGLKIITHSHSTKFSDRLIPSIRNRLLCLGINKNTDLRLACSKTAGIVLYGHNTDFKVINNAIEMDRYIFNPLKRCSIRKLLSIDDKIVIGHVGRFNQCKNHKFLIETFAEFHKLEKKSILLLIGEGPTKCDILALVHDFGLSNDVIFLGMRADVADIYNAMDVFVLPSQFEGLGVVLIEAQVNGIPCIASSYVPVESNIGGVKFLSLAKQPQYWCQKIAECISLQRDKQSKMNYIQAGMLGYDIRTAVKMLSREYISLISDKTVYGFK